MKKQIFEMIASSAGNRVWAQVVAANHIPVGEKALWQNQNLVYATKEMQSFWQSQEKAILNTKKNGLLTLDYQGENVQVYQEKIGQSKKLIICGGGHISLAVHTIGQMLGFEVTVIDDRIAFANEMRFPHAHIICKPFVEALKEVPYGPDCFFVIVTRGHVYDQVCLKEIIEKEYAYLGMIGSRVRVRKVKEQFLADGVSQELLEQLHAPIGLKIGAETPEEIAVSIFAEIIAEKNKMPSFGGFEEELLQSLLQCTKPAALITIVERKGSAPREVGTKMLVYEDGRMIGTIGGGCVEADLRRNALYAIDTGEPLLHTADITGRDAAEEGMVCGGILTIFVDPLVR